MSARARVVALVALPLALAALVLAAQGYARAASLLLLDALPPCG